MPKALSNTIREWPNKKITKNTTKEYNNKSNLYRKDKNNSNTWDKSKIWDKSKTLEENN
jgi:hypothetical protein